MVNPCKVFSTLKYCNCYWTMEITSMSHCEPHRSSTPAFRRADDGVTCTKVNWRKRALVGRKSSAKMPKRSAKRRYFDGSARSERRRKCNIWLLVCHRPVVLRQAEAANHSHKMCPFPVKKVSDRFICIACVHCKWVLMWAFFIYSDYQNIVFTIFVAIKLCSKYAHCKCCS